MLTTPRLSIVLVITLSAAACSSNGDGDGVDQLRAARFDPTQIGGDLKIAAVQLRHDRGRPLEPDGYRCCAVVRK